MENLDKKKKAKKSMLFRQPSYYEYADSEYDEDDEQDILHWNMTKSRVCQKFAENISAEASPPKFTQRNIL